MKPKVSYADLLRAISQTSIATQGGVAQALHWQRLQHSGDTESSSQGASSRGITEIEGASKLKIQDVYLAKFPPLYWQVSQCQPEVAQTNDESLSEPSVLAAGSPQPRAINPLSHLPIMSPGDWQNLWDKLPILSRHTGRIDIPASIEKVTRGQPVTRLQRLKKQIFNRPVILIMDLPEDSEPIDRDLHLGKKSLQFLMGNNLQSFSLHHGPKGRWLHLTSLATSRLNQTQALELIDPQALVIVMGAFGASTTGMMHEDWQIFIQHLVNKAQQCVAVNAVPIQKSVVKLLPLRPAGRSHVGAVDQLLAVISQVLWVSLPRLRALRLALGDATLVAELQIMSHPKVIYKSGKLNLLPKYHAYYTQQYLLLDDGIKKRVERVIKQGRGHLHVSIQTIERFYADTFKPGTMSQNNYPELSSLAQGAIASLAGEANFARAHFCTFLPSLNQAAKHGLDASWEPLLNQGRKIATQLNLTPPQQRDITGASTQYSLSQTGSRLCIMKNGGHLLDVTEFAYSPSSGPLVTGLIAENETLTAQVNTETTQLISIPLDATHELEVIDNHQRWVLQANARPLWAQRMWRDADGLFGAHESGLVLRLLEASPQRPQAQWQAQELEQTWPWASQAGVDQYGLWAEFAIEKVVQRLRWIVQGTFKMGSPDEGKLDRQTDENQHTVLISHGYWLADTACTQALWQQVMGKNPSQFNDNAQSPVEQVSWDDCQEFIITLNQTLGGHLTLRLPTEAQWEYACRAGTTSPFNTGVNITTAQANYDGNWPDADAPKGEYRQKTVPVDRFVPNSWGLYQMHGNVWEWCNDCYSEYPKGFVTDPDGLADESAEGHSRVLRGGCWINDAPPLRSAFRDHSHPDDRFHFFGLRLAGGFNPQLGGAEAEKKALGADRWARSDRKGGL